MKVHARLRNFKETAWSKGIATLAQRYGRGIRLGSRCDVHVNPQTFTNVEHEGQS